MRRTHNQGPLLGRRGARHLNVSRGSLELLLPTPNLVKTSASGDPLKFSVDNLVPDEVVGHDWYLEVGGGVEGTPDFTDGPGSETTPRIQRRQITYADFTSGLVFTAMDSLPNGFVAVRLSIKADDGSTSALSNVVSDTVVVFEDVTMNSADMDSRITLTDPLTVSHISSTLNSYRGIRATAGRSSGKWYFEAVHTGATDAKVGMTTIVPSVASNILPGGSGGVPGFHYDYSRHDVYGNTVETSYGTAQAEGSVVGFYVDQDAGLFWVAFNGVVVSGDPASGTGGKAFSTDGPLYLWVAPRINTTIKTVALRLAAASQTYTPVGDFQPYNGAA